jgi:aspartate racemase
MMRTIGMLGGMSWESTLNYYKAINQGIKARLGGLHSARISLYSVDFGEIEKMQQAGRWDQITASLVRAALCVEAGGADFLLICTNTMHKLAPDIEAALSIPLVHIADATAERILGQGINKVGLLGTRFTMEESFYKGRMAEKFGLEVLVPEADDRNFVHQVIYNELCLGQVHDLSHRRYLDIINRLGEKGARAVILGCTEIGLLVNQAHTAVPLFDTTAIHAAKAVELALAD